MESGPVTDAELVAAVTARRYLRPGSAQSPEPRAVCDYLPNVRLLTGRQGQHYASGFGKPIQCLANPRIAP